VRFRGSSTQKDALDVSGVSNSIHAKVFTVEEDTLIERMFFDALPEEPARSDGRQEKRSGRDALASNGCDKAVLHVVPQRVRHIMHRAMPAINPGKNVSEADQTGRRSGNVPPEAIPRPA
jgi:hypothetical protein